MQLVSQVPRPRSMHGCVSSSATVIVGPLTRQGEVEVALSDECCASQTGLRVAVINMLSLGMCMPCCLLARREVRVAVIDTQLHYEVE